MNCDRDKERGGIASFPNAFDRGFSYNALCMPSKWFYRFATTETILCDPSPNVARQTREDDRQSACWFPIAATPTGESQFVTGRES